MKSLLALALVFLGAASHAGASPKAPLFSCHLITAEGAFISVNEPAADEKSAEIRVIADYLTLVNGQVIPKAEADGHLPPEKVMVITDVQCAQVQQSQ